MKKHKAYTPFEAARMLGKRFYEQYEVDQRIATLEANQNDVSDELLGIIVAAFQYTWEGDTENFKKGFNLDYYDVKFDLDKIQESRDAKK